MKSFKKIVVVSTLSLLGFSFCLYNLQAEVLTGSNYQIENPSVDAGDSQASSSNYTEQGSVGSSNDASSSSTNYSIFPGFVQHAYPGVPAKPTLTNTGGSLYNSLDYVVATGGNATDTQFSIAISPDSFATTYFVQTDNTIATSTAWQTFSNWGGSGGGRVTGLTASTTYQIKVKARFGVNTETAYSITAQASTASQNFTMTINGVNSGVTVGGATATVTTTPTSISYGSLVSGTTSVAIQQITITTNASGGYTTTILQNNNLTNGSGQTISPVSGSNASPATFPTSISTGVFGYHTSDATLCTGTVTRFSAADSYSALTSSPAEIACSQSAVTNDTTSIVYKVLIGSLQASGVYNNIITYVSYGIY